MIVNRIFAVNMLVEEEAASCLRRFRGILNTWATQLRQPLNQPDCKDKDSIRSRLVVSSLPPSFSLFYLFRFYFSSIFPPSLFFITFRFAGRCFVHCIDF